jgi:hypothetical protein
MSVLIASPGDLAFQGNQLNCRLGDSDQRLLWHAMLMATATRASGNSAFEPEDRCMFSMRTVGSLFNTTVDNHGAHCIIAQGPPSGVRERDNLVMFPDPKFCPQPDAEDPRTTMSTYMKYLNR